jgi:hypothetical protein
LRCLGALKAHIGSISTFRPVSGMPLVPADREAAR